MKLPSMYTVSKLAVKAFTMPVVKRPFPYLFVSEEFERTRQLREAYRETATRDIDPDLGFSELLHVL